MLDLDRSRAPVAPTDAATLIVVRAGRGSPESIEVFVVERHRKSQFLGGALVFPGGKVDSGDGDPRFAELCTPLGARTAELGDGGARALAFVVAALRELLEEGALLPVTGSLGDKELQELRAELARRVAAGSAAGVAFADLLAERRLVLDGAKLEGMARWITPAAEARRYDTRFYMVRAPANQSGAHDRHETTTSLWASPRSLLQRWESRQIFLAPPTARTLELLAKASSVEGALAIARAQPLAPICPFFVMDGDLPTLALAGDPLHPDGSPPPVDPAAPTRFVLLDGRFVSRRAG